MDAQFPVQWRQVSRSVTIYMSIGILIPISCIIGLRVWKFGAAEAFRHMTPLGASIGVVAIIGVSSVFGFFIARCFRVWAVRVTDEFLEGRNYWGVRRRIPLRAIESLSRFSSYGIEAIVVSSRNHGNVYVSVHTENLSDLVELLSTYLPADKEP